MYRAYSSAVVGGKPIACHKDLFRLVDKFVAVYGDAIQLGERLPVEDKEEVYTVMRDKEIIAFIVKEKV